MSINTEILEPTPNVKLVRDALGRRWLCDATVEDDTELSGQGCCLDDEFIYDRNFGG